MSTIRTIKYKLKGHGSFAIREGWLYKGITAVKANPNLFRKSNSEENNDITKQMSAADVLGVGNNMAQAIRFWLKACNLIEERVATGAQLTNLGDIIYNYDPYFEDIFTLWIIHYNLVSNSDAATSWYLFFNKCEAEELTRDEIDRQMKRELMMYANISEYSEKSLEDDIAVLTNMYSKAKEHNPEESMISPLAYLGLLKEYDHKYTKVQPDLSYVDERVILYILIKQMGNENSISIDSLVDEENSIGKIMNMGRIAINLYLDKLEKEGFIIIVRTSGLDTIYKNRINTSLDVVKDYYQNCMN